MQLLVVLALGLNLENFYSLDFALKDGLWGVLSPQSLSRELEVG